jgi:uncharacterized damage-inducible protein DinB
MLSEIETYIERLRELRAQILKTLDGSNADALNWRPTPSESNSLFALATHSLGAERRWLHEVVGLRKIERDRAAEFRARGDDVAALRITYEAVARESEKILARLTEADMETLRGDPPKAYTVRWCILHVVEHYCEHLGQMYLTRQLWESDARRMT